MNGPEAAATGRPPAPMPASGPTHVRLLDDDDEDAEQAFADVMARTRASAQAASRAVADVFGSGDPNLAVLGRPAPRRAGRPAPLDESDMDLDDPEPLAAALGFPGPMPAPSRGIAAAAAAAAAGAAAAGLQPPGSLPSAVARFGGANRFDEEEEDLPAGVSSAEMEEARMLEAALLGVPYEGRMPDFSQRNGQPSEPADPSVREGRSLRWEQDRAYEESLAADRAKAQSLAAAARAQEEEERRRQEEERRRQEAVEAEQAAVRAAEEALAAALRQKAAALPAEPGASDPGAVTLMVRLPDGSRQSRRFAKSTPLQRVFDFVDVQCAGKAARPGSYSLVTQFPRRVLQPEGGRQTLEQAGLTSDTALLMELNVPSGA